MARYIDIVRHFRDLHKEVVPPDVRRMMRSWSSRESSTWRELLGGEHTTPIVLVAPSLSGKTAEFERCAVHLRKSGLHAIYCEAGAIVDGFEAGLAGEERLAYERWSQTAEPLTLFIDAVDELYLRQRAPQDLVNMLERTFTFSAVTVRLVLSTRTGTWTEDTARPLLGMLERNKYPTPRTVRFEALDLVAVRTLASARGVTDIDAFMKAFDDDGLDALLDLRPLDVAALAMQWCAARRFGHWSQVLAEFVNASFTEDDLLRSRRRQLTLGDGWKGLMRVAAACILVQSPHLSLPTVASIEGAVSSRRLFEDWPSPMLGELLENPLFVHKGAGAEAVQLPQGALMYFLMGRWVAERAKRGLKAEEIRDALMVQVNGEARHRIPGPYRATVGWVAACNPDFRRLIQREHPQIVLFEGDPDALSEAEISISLDALCAQLAAGNSERHASRTFLRKLARPGIEPDVLRLLRVHAHSEEAQTCLLALATHGRYKSCVELSLGLALDCKQDGYVRAGAIDVVGSTGDLDQKRSLRILADETDDHVRTAVLRWLVPEVLCGQELVSFLTRGGDFYFRDCLRTKTAELLDDADLDATLRSLNLAGAHGQDGDERVAGAAVALLNERLKRTDATAPHVIEALAQLERLAETPGVYVGEIELQGINEALRSNTAARRALWNERLSSIKRDSSRYQYLHAPGFGAIEHADFPWLWATAQGDQNAKGVLEDAWAKLGKDGREQVRASAPPELLEQLDHVTAREAAVERRKTEEDARREQKRLAELRQNEAEIEARREQIESGQDLHALSWAWQRLVGQGLSDEDTDLVRLRQFVGPEQVELFRRGFIACWRKQKIEVPALGHQNVQVRYLAGLIGVSLEARTGLRLTSLSKAEVHLAARYALYKHGLPVWLSDLLHAHPESVLEVLYPVIDSEWDFEGDHHGVLSVAAHAAKEVRAAIRDRAVELVHDRVPASERTLHWAVDLFLTESGDREVLAEVARGHVEQRDASVDRVEWFRLWAHFDPLLAVQWLSKAAIIGGANDEMFFRIAEALERDLDGHRGRPVVSAFYSPRALAVWSELLLRFVPVEGDVQDHKLHLIGPRDQARFLRQRCLNALAGNPAPEARVRLLELVEDPRLAAHRGFLSELVEQQHQATANAAIAPWIEADVLDVEQGDERLPRSVSELSRLVRRHLRYVHQLIANDDFSYRAIFREDTKERELQLWVASCLRERARGLYQVVRENVVDRNKEVDISAFAPTAGSVPIEIKPLGKYSFDQLETVIRDQLLGRYMLPADRQEGVLLLVRLRRKTWRISGRPVDFGTMVAKLRACADLIGRRAGKIIHVECIDLLDLPAPTKRVAAPRRSKRASRSGASRSTKAQAARTTVRREAPRGRK